MTAHALDQPLPAELTGRSQGWFTEYRRYPVFSRPWVRGRWRLIGPIVAFVIGSISLAAGTSGVGSAPWGGLAEITLSLLVPALVGPWIASRVRRRGLEPRREGIALAVAIGAVVAAMLLFNLFGTEPMKQWIAEQTGQVDEHGKRKRLQMMIGISVTSPDDPTPAMPAESREQLPPTVRLLNAAAVAFITFLLAGGAGLVRRQRERDGLAALAREKELARSEAARREAELQLSVLAAQVEPHFLFNTLAGVRSAIATDPQRASGMIDHLVEYLRAAIPRLRSDGSAASTVGSQFELARAYLALMSARMPRLAYRVQIEPGLEDARCPPLMLISLVENAVKHGVEPKLGPATVELVAERGAEAALIIHVLDNGVGFGEAGSGAGIGLANIRERLRQAYGDRASLALKARPEGGVAATLTLPLEETP